MTNNRQDDAEKLLLQWLGTAGFRMSFGGKTILIDPFLSRNERARPVQTLRAGDMADADYVFLSHGHYDHIADIPDIARAPGFKGKIYCSEVTAGTLKKKGVASAFIKTLSGGELLELGEFNVAVRAINHIVFDLKLVLKTAPAVLRRAREFLPNARGMPSGPVLVFSLSFGGITVMHMGSLGLTPKDLEENPFDPPDIFLPPLQGHSDICRLAAVLTAALRPRAVVPQHHDDFSPPLSRSVDIEPFRRLLLQSLPGCKYYEPEMNRVFSAGEVFDMLP